MENTLHILNGDSTRLQVQKAGLKGDLCVWHDVLSDGPAIEAVGSEEFWQKRQNYMTSSFEVSPEEFERKGKQEFEKIRKFRDYEEVVLWFEYDLFCQVNLIALMHWFNGQDRDETKISLICVGREEGYDRLVGLGELPAERYPELFARRRIMGTYDFTFASDAYQAWCSPDPTDLDNFILMSSNEFPYLSDALRSHHRRFPSAQTGLDLIESKVIELTGSGMHDRRKVVGALLLWQTHYGFGDSQYFQVLDRMESLFEPGEDLVVREAVKHQLAAEKPLNLINRNYFLGGAKAGEWYWDDKMNELIPREISPS